ncbi:unnamed protein product [Toxocara canis]|uniref:Protein Jade-3 n=1 Tax=Toxocara canis TaxID=6265 RepID=A0A183UAF7_TOXCA|nr:unnamed protein product [Toxocara canis]
MNDLKCGKTASNYEKKKFPSNGKKTKKKESSEEILSDSGKKTPKTPVSSGSVIDGKRVMGSASYGAQYSRTPTIDMFSSDDDDMSDEYGSAKRKKFYLVTYGDRPAELFRTDLSYFKKDDDSSSDEEAPPMRITDRWKEGCTHVQMPLSNKWPEFVVNSEPSSSSSTPSSRLPYQKNEKLIAVHDACYVDEEYSRVKMPPLLSYQIDRLDQLYLETLNKRRGEIGLPPIAEEVFGEIIDRFEVETYKAIHRDLLAPLASPTPLQAELDEDASCDICRQADYEDDDEIIFCDGCNVSVHQSCYGLDSVPHDEWLCNACTLLGFKAQPRCVLCPLRGGAMKCMKGGETWAHVVCALWIPEVRFGDVDHREPITNISDIPSERWALRCSVCDTKQGACIQCSVKTCTTAFHVTCALRNEQEMRIEHDSTVEDGVRMVSLCGKHSSLSGADNSTSLRRGSPKRAVRCTKPREELRRMEEVFFLYVSPEDVARDLRIELEMVDDVYEYWKMKRIDNGNRTLLDDVSEVDLDMSPQEGYDANPSSMLSIKMQSETKLRQNLEKARNLCYMVGKREKHKKEIIGCCQETFAFVKSALKGMNVPLSTRALGRYCEALSVYASLGGPDVDITSSPSSLVIYQKPSEKLEHSLRNKTDTFAAHEIAHSMLERSANVSPPTGRERVLQRFTSLQSSRLVVNPPLPPNEPQFFHLKLSSPNRKIRERNGPEFHRRASLPSNGLIAIPSIPSTNSDSRWFQLKSSPHKIRERNGPVSPRRLPSQRASAIKANLSLDSFAHFPFASKRSS